MELKFLSGELFTLFNSFKSHLYGIEIRCNQGRDMRLSWFKSHLYGIEIMKPLQKNGHKLAFKSHLYGIEIGVAGEPFRNLLLFKSHLYGIEIDTPYQRRCGLPRLNRTFMELK